MTLYPSPSIPDHLPPSPSAPLSLLVSRCTVHHALHQHPRVEPAMLDWPALGSPSVSPVHFVFIIRDFKNCFVESSYNLLILFPVLSPISLSSIPLQPLSPKASPQNLPFVVTIDSLNSQFQISSCDSSTPQGIMIPESFPSLLFLIAP